MTKNGIEKRDIKIKFFADIDNQIWFNFMDADGNIIYNGKNYNDIVELDYNDLHYDVYDLYKDGISYYSIFPRIHDNNIIEPVATEIIFFTRDKVYNNHNDINKINIWNGKSYEEIDVDDFFNDAIYVGLKKDNCEPFIYLYGSEYIYKYNSDIFIFINKYSIREFYYSINDTFNWEIPNESISVYNFETSAMKHHQISCVEKYNDGFIIRFFQDRMYFNVYPFEYMRITFDNTGRKLYKRLNNGWCEMDLGGETSSVCLDNLWAPIVYVGKGVYDTSFMYYIQYFYLQEEIIPEEYYECAFLMAKGYLAILYPGFDNLFKLDISNEFYKELYYAIDYSHYLDSGLTRIFGEFNEYETSFCKMVGIPQWMLDTFFTADCIEYIRKLFMMTFVGHYKSLLGRDYFYNIDKDTFYQLLNFYKSNRFMCIEILDNLVDRWGKSGLRNYIRKIETMAKENNLRFYNDYILMACEISERHPEFTWNISSDNVHRMHDNITTIYNYEINNKDDEKIKEMFNIRKLEWERYLFSDSNFTIISPDSPLDIIIEGTTLHHCVKSYINKIAAGYTTILFIRKNDEINRPYFTLEIKNGKIRQCHGFANCNVTDEVNNFLKDFCKEKDVEYNNPNSVLAAE